MTSYTIDGPAAVSGLTSNSFLYSGISGLLTSTSAPTNGQILIGSTGVAPVLSTLTAGSGITITNGSGSITISSTGGGGGVSTFSAGTTGFTPNTPTSGAVTLSGTLSHTNGGTGLASTPTNGQLLIGNGAGYALSTLTAGTGVGITNGAGSITIANTGVTSLTGTANQITVSSSTGAVTLSLPSTVTITTSLTVSGLTANSFLYSGTSGLLTTTSAPTNGQLLIGRTGLAPVASTLTPGTGVSVTNGSGTITIANTGVTSLTGTANQVSVSASTGAVTISLPSNVTITSSLTVSGLTSNAFLYSGTSGLLTTTSSPTNGQLLIGSTGNPPVANTLTAGTGISVTNGPGSVTVASTSQLGTSAFFATLTSDLVLGNNATITGAWTTTYNDGGNFNTTTGTYTTPGAGLYQISFQASSSANGNVTSLVIDGVIVASARPSGTNTTAGNSLTLKLTAGQVVLMNIRSASTIQQYAGGIATPIPRLGGTYFSVVRLT